MKSYQANWEDAEASRQVELVVNYRLDETRAELARVELGDVTPTRVTFLCSKTGQAKRSIGVWTEGGRKLLARQAAAAGRLKTLAQEIAEGSLVEIKHTLPKSASVATPVLQA
ncbi:MAG TPA: hypothetical protein VGM76_02945 [Lacipirellulaceae bacterium]|jgi:hypothetical protein